VQTMPGCIDISRPQGSNMAAPHCHPGIKIWLTTPFYWSKRGARRGRKSMSPMSQRAGLAVLLSAVLFGSGAAAERAGAPAPVARAASGLPVASEVRVAGDDTQTRFVVDLDKTIDIRAFTLANPYRVV